MLDAGADVFVSGLLDEVPVRAAFVFTVAWSSDTSQLLSQKLDRKKECLGFV